MSEVKHKYWLIFVSGNQPECKKEITSWLIKTHVDETPMDWYLKWRATDPQENGFHIELILRHHEITKKQFEEQTKQFSQFEFKIKKTSWGFDPTI